MTITYEQVEFIAGQAKIKADKAELTRYCSDLEEMVSFVAGMDEIDTSSVEPTFYGLHCANRLRQDIAVESPPREVLLEKAPERDETCYIVPEMLS